MSRFQSTAFFSDLLGSSLDETNTDANLSFHNWYLYD